MAVSEEEMKLRFEFERQRAAQQSAPEPEIDYQKQMIEEMGTGETLLVAAGREFSKLGSGMADIWDRMTGDEKGRIAREIEQKKEDELYAPLAEAKPVATTLGSVAPYLATGLTGLVRAAPKIAGKQGLAQTLKMLGLGTAEGTAIGGAHYDDTAETGALFGLGGGMVGKSIGKFMGGTRKALSEAEEPIIEFAKKNKLFVPPGMKTGNIRLQQLDQGMKTGATSDIFEQNVRKSGARINEMISEKIGDKTKSLSEDFFTRNFKKIGGQMDELAETTTGRVDDGLLYKAIGISENFKKTAGLEKAPKMLRDVEDVLAELVDSGGNLSGKQYEKMTKLLNKQVNRQMKPLVGDEDLGFALRDMKGLFDDAIESGMDSGKAAAWKNVRKKYGLLAETAKATNVSGFVDPSKLSRNLSKRYRTIDPDVKMLGKYKDLSKAQRGASLSTSHILGQIFNAAKSPLATLNLLGARAAGGIGMGKGLLSNIYLSGYPHATGLAPIFGKRTPEVLENMIRRSTYGTGAPENETGLF